MPSVEAAVRDVPRFSVQVRLKLQGDLFEHLVGEARPAVRCQAWGAEEQSDEKESAQVSGAATHRRGRARQRMGPQ